MGVRSSREGANRPVGARRDLSPIDLNGPPTPTREAAITQEIPALKRGESARPTASRRACVYMRPEARYTEVPARLDPAPVG